MTEPRFSFVVDKGPSLGSQLLLTAGSFAVGRNPGNDLVLTGDDFVSGTHAELKVTPKQVRLRNLSQNGTLVNGQPVIESELAPGDVVSIGMRHLLVLRPYERPARPAAAPRPRAVSEPSDGPMPDAAQPVKGFRLPIWLTLYLVLMAGLFVFFAFIKFTSQGTPGLKEVQAMEQQYAAEHKLTPDETVRVLHLLETASVHDRSGDAASASEAYREVLGARRPLQPESPAYRFAAARLAALEEAQ
ncbi:MAG TPA: FHA domain-containing protein [Vicinamibacterales bacterium]|nr:FHA domain-containing protein [Vicinamibacterales bacterium]